MATSPQNQPLASSTAPAKKDRAGFALSSETQKSMVAYAAGVLSAKKKFTEIHNKMEAIDQAYARYSASTEQGTDGVDRGAGNTSCDALGTDSVVAPIVVSQVDSMVAYLADVFLSGTPLFPVVSSPAKRTFAEQLETLVDDHASLGGYARQLLMFFRDGVKYNIAALEADWDMIEQFSVVSDFSTAAGQKIDRSPKYFTKLRRWDMYNTVWDYNVAPGDVSREGDFAGHVEIISKTKLKRLLNKYSAMGQCYNASAALENKGETVQTFNNYIQPPTVSDYISVGRPTTVIDWEAFILGTNQPRPLSSIAGGQNVELFTLYARIVPTEFGITGGQPNTPQIWKMVFVNSGILIHAKRIISAQDILPVLFGQPCEDGLGYQTKSIAEGEIGIQKAVSTLFDIRFAAARRTVSDRALYDPSMIKPSDINAPVPAPKIPVQINPLSQKGLEQAYKQIPFDTRGTESTIQDAATLVGFSKDLSGLNGPQQGQFQKGNKSVQEWNDTMGGSDNRLRLPALTLEIQVFVPLKEIIKLNIFQYGEDTVVVSQKSGDVVEIKIDELRRQVLSFKMADGYTPKSKLASTDMLTTGLTLISQSQVLQQAYGNMLPAMFAHMMQLGGVKGLEEYNPQNQQTQTQATPPAGLAANGLQTPPALPAPAAPGMAPMMPPDPSMMQPPVV